jgi:hypothetical protein
MITSLPIGTWVCYAYHGTTEYSKIVQVNGGIGFETGPLPSIGEIVHKGVWKGDKFESYKTFTMTQKIVDKYQEDLLRFYGITEEDIKNQRKLFGLD